MQLGHHAGKRSRTAKRADVAFHAARPRRRVRPAILACAAFAGLAATLLAVGAAHAQFSMQNDVPSRFEWRGHIETEYRNEFATKSDGGDEFDAWRAGIAGEFGGPINESILIGFGGRYRYSSYDFNLDTPSPASFGGIALPRDPWNTLNTLDFLPSATVLVGHRVSVTAAVPIRWAAETGADRNGFAAGISALVRWQVTDALAVGAGLGVTSKLEDGPETFPVFSVRWRISENLDFETSGSWFQGGRARLLWGPNDAIRLSLSAGYERTRFRLDDNGNAADRNGIGEVTTVPIEVGLRFRLAERLSLSVHAGLGVEGRLRVETDRGRRLYNQKFDPAPRVGFNLEIPIGLSPRRTDATPPTSGSSRGGR